MRQAGAIMTVINRAGRLRCSLRNAGFPTSLLPVVVPTATKIGHTSNSAFGLPLGIPVYVAAGDAQCSAISTQFRRHQAVLNLGTSCQLSFLSPPGCCGDNPHLQAWPFQKENHLLVAASMNGGNVLAAFVDMLRCWLSDLDIEITDDKIWSKIAAMSEPVDTGSGSPLLIKPTMLKERTTPRKQEGATVLNILPTNVSLASTYQALCVGLIQNINEMLPVNQLQDNSISEIICTGSLFSKHPFMLTAVQQVYQNITVRIIEEEVNAALGSILMTEM